MAGANEVLKKLDHQVQQHKVSLNYNTHRLDRYLEETGILKNRIVMYKWTSVLLRIFLIQSLTQY